MVMVRGSFRNNSLQCNGYVHVAFRIFGALDHAKSESSRTDAQIELHETRLMLLERFGNEHYLNFRIISAVHQLPFD